MDKKFLEKKSHVIPYFTVPDCNLQINFSYLCTANMELIFHCFSIVLVRVSLSFSF